MNGSSPESSVKQPDAKKWRWRVFEKERGREACRGSFVGCEKSPAAGGVCLGLFSNSKHLPLWLCKNTEPIALSGGRKLAWFMFRSSIILLPFNHARIFFDIPLEEILWRSRKQGQGLRDDIQIYQFYSLTYKRFNIWDNVN